MIDTIPYDQFGVEILGPGGGFVVGRNVVGDTISNDPLVWLSYTPKSCVVNTTRDATSGALFNSPNVGTMSVTLHDPDGVEDWDNDLQLRPNVPIRFTVSGVPIFTGWLRDVGRTYGNEGQVTMVLSAVDAVAALNQTTRYGAASLQNFETFPERAARITSGVDVPVTIEQTAVTELPMQLGSWTMYGPTSAYTFAALEQAFWYPDSGLTGGGLLGLTVGFYDDPGAGTTTIPALTLGAQRTVTGLTVGKTYRVSARIGGTFADPAVPHVIGVQGLGFGAPVDPPVYGSGEAHRFNEVEYVFTATATSHVVRLAFGSTWTGPKGSYVHISWPSARVEEYSPSVRYRLRDIAREGSIATHLNILTDSVNAAWWPTRTGGVQVSSNLPSDVVATFSDVTYPSYVTVGLSYDTQSVINDWEFTNLGIDPSTGNTADDRYNAFDDESAATYGRRSGRVETSLYDEGAWAGSVARRMAEIADDSATAIKGPVTISFRPSRTAALAPALALDLFSLVRIVHRGAQYLCRVQAIRHSISAGRWTCDLTLRKAD